MNKTLFLLTIFFYLKILVVCFRLILFQTCQEARTYINSKHFMLHFEQSFYYILKQLNKSSLINSAKVCPPKMMCKDEREDSTDINNNNSTNAQVKESWQDFVPSIIIPFWPNEATEWYLRKRKTRR